MPRSIRRFVFGHEDETRPSLMTVKLVESYGHALAIDGTEPTLSGTDGLEPVVKLAPDRGELEIIPEPEGTRGYGDLRRDATREHIGQGLRLVVASLGDLSRMLAALGREDDMPKLLNLARLAEREISH